MASAQTLVFPEPLITALSTGLSLCILAPVLYYIWFVYRRKMDHVGIFGGLSAFFLFGYLITGLLLGVLAPEEKQESMGPFVYPLVRGLIISALEVGGIWAGLWLMRRVRTGGTCTIRVPIGVGLGYSLFELLILARREAFNPLVCAVNVNQDGLQAMLDNAEPEAVAELEELLRKLAATSPGEVWMNTAVIICLFVLAVCTARLLWYSMEGGLRPADIRFLPLVFIVRLAGESLLALYQSGGGSFAVCAGIYYVLTAALACFTWYESGQRDSKELLHDEHLKSRIRPKR